MKAAYMDLVDKNSVANPTLTAPNVATGSSCENGLMPPSNVRMHQPVAAPAPPLELALFVDVFSSKGRARFLNSVPDGGDGQEREQAYGRGRRPDFLMGQQPR